MDSSSFLVMSATTIIVIIITLLMISNNNNNNIAFGVSASTLPGFAELSELSPPGVEDAGFSCSLFDTEGTTGKAPSLMLVGGSGTNGLESDVWQYDLQNKKWNKLLSENFDSNQIAFTLLAMDVGDGSIDLVAIGGKKFSTNTPIEQVQAFTGSAWTIVDAHAASGGIAESSRAYWSASWSATGLFGADSVDVWMTDGVSDEGYSRDAYRVSINRTRGARSASWQPSLIGTNPTNSGRDPVFGSCCAKDPTRPSERKSVCFGGSGESNDVDQVTYINYASGSPYYEVKTPLGTGPSARRLASCAFVAQDQFVVTGGFDSSRGGAIQDEKSYILDVSSDPPVWYSLDNYLLRPAFGAKMTTCYFANGTTQTFLFGGNLGDLSYNSYLYRWLGFGYGYGFIPETLSTAGTVSSDLIPSGRAFHNAVEFKSSIILFNGISEKDEPLNDIWWWLSDSETWVFISFFLTGEWTPRFMSSAKVISSVITFYGGFTDAGFVIVARDLVEVDVVTGTVRVTPDSTTGAPGGRAAFGNFMQNKIFVVSGGKGDLYQTKASWHGYNTLTQTWAPMYYQGNSTLHTEYESVFKRYGHFAEAYNDTHAIMGLGFSAEAPFDLYWVHNISTTEERFDIIPISTDFLINGTRRDFIRAFGGAILTGNTLLICGGQSYAGIAPSLDATCYGVDVVSEYWFTLGASETREFRYSGHQVSYISNTMYFTGGYKSNEVAFVRNTHQDVIRYTFDKTIMCPENQRASADFFCIDCAPGSFINASTGECDLAAKGKYVKNAISGVQSCSKGAYQNSLGARDSTECTVCAIQTYAPTEGLSTCLPCPENSYCPVGARQALPSTSSRALLLRNVPSPTESHPPDQPSLPVPWKPIIVIVSVIAGVFILLIFITIVGWHAKRKRASHYLTPDIEKTIEELHRVYSVTNRWGLSEFDLFKMLTAERNAALPNHDIDAETSYRLFATVDRYRSGYMSRADTLKEAIILAIATGHLEAFPDTPAAENPKLVMHPALSFLSGIDLSTLDFFDDKHKTAENGESNIIVKNWYGGLLFLIMCVTMVALIMAVILNFLLNNILESKQAVPRAVIYSIFEGEGLQVSTPIIAKITVFGLLRFNQGVSNLKDGCIRTNTVDQCHSATATPLGVFAPDRTSSSRKTAASLPTTLTCTFDDAEEACIVTWVCEDCYFSEGPDGGNVTFTVDPSYASPLVKAQVEVGTSLRKPTQGSFGQVYIAGGPLQFSTSTSYVAPLSNATVFSGFPASTWNFGLTNTYFEAQDHDALVGRSNTHYGKGYHIRELARPTEGSSVTPQFFDKKFDVPVTLRFFVDATPVLVSRKFLSTLVDLISSLLGTFAGVMGGFIAILQFLDEKTGGNDNFDEDSDKLVDRFPADEKKEDTEEIPKNNDNENNKDSPPVIVNNNNNNNNNNVNNYEHENINNESSSMTDNIMPHHPLQNTNNNTNDSERHQQKQQKRSNNSKKPTKQFSAAFSVSSGELLINENNKPPVDNVTFFRVEKLIASGLTLHQAKAIIDCLEIDSSDPDSVKPLPGPIDLPEDINDNSITDDTEDDDDSDDNNKNENDSNSNNNNARPESSEEFDQHGNSMNPHHQQNNNNKNNNHNDEEMVLRNEPPHTKKKINNNNNNNNRNKMVVVQEEGDDAIPDQTMSPPQQHSKPSSASSNNNHDDDDHQDVEVVEDDDDKYEDQQQETVFVRFPV